MSPGLAVSPRNGNGDRSDGSQAGLGPAPSRAATHERWTSAAAAFNSMKDSVGVYRSILDQDGRFLDAEIDFVNDVGRRRWFDDVSVDEARGAPVFARWPHLRPLVFDLYAAAAESGLAHHETRELVIGDGSGMFDLTITPIPGGLVHVGRDVTDERRALAALNESEERLRRTIAGVDAIIAFQDEPDGPLLLAGQVEAILGWRPEDVRTDTAWRALIHPDDLAACASTWASPAGSWTMEYRMRRGDGAWIWVSDVGRRNQPGDTARPLRIGSVVDITAQRAAADALRSSEERLRRMVEGIDAIVAYQEPGRGPVTLSPQVERILGWRPDEVAAFQDWNAIVHPDDLAHCVEAWAQSDAMWDLEYRVLRKDGSWAWISDRGRRLGPNDERARGMFGVMTDTTARHEAATRFQAIFEENPEAIALCRPVLDADGHFLDAEIVEANRMARARGLTPDPHTPRMLSVWPDPDSRLREAAARVCEHGETFRGEVCIGFGEEELWSDVSFFPFAGGFALVGRDITAQKRADLALRDNEARYRAVTDSATDAIVTIDAAGTLASWNPSARRMFGYGGDEAIGQPASTLFAPASAAGYREMEQGLRDGDGGLVGSQTVEGVARRRDGSDVPVEMSMAEWTVGGARFATAIIRDIGERRRAEEAVRLADARLHRFFDANIVGTLVAQPDGRVVEANDYWLSLTGHTRDELDAGLVDWRRITPPESLAADDRAMTEVRDQVTNVPIEKDYLLRDGSRVPVLVVRSAMPGAGEQVASFVLDLTAIREASADLARLAAAIEQTSDSVVVTDLDARITYVNPAFERVTGYARHEVLGQNPRILQSGEQPAATYVEMWAALKSGSTWHGEFVNRRRDGSALIEDVSVSPIRDEAGAITAYVAVKRDITGERALEAQLRQAQRIEAIGQLAGGVAHDFNNILAAIRGYGELAQSSLPLGSTSRSDIDEVLRAADRAATLTHQLLAFSRRQIMAKEILEPAAVIDELIPMLGRLLGPHIGITATHPRQRGRVLADRGNLEQVIVNLAVNARDAMPDGGSLRIETSSIAAGDADAPSTGGLILRITVADTGVGMDSATLDRIFEPFYTTKAAGKGTGMGLATVDGIVHQLDGTIRVKSTPGHGSAFLIDLPALAASGQPDVAPPQARTHQVGGTERILLVDDEPAIRALTERQLRGLGYDVEAASSAEEAIERASRALQAFDLVVTDVRMPGMQGPALARQLIAMRPDARVLFITGLADELTDSLADLDRSVHVLEKPFSVPALALAVRDVLDSA